MLLVSHASGRRLVCKEVLEPQSLKSPMISQDVASSKVKFTAPCCLQLLPKKLVLPTKLRTTSTLSLPYFRVTNILRSFKKDILKYSFQPAESSWSVMWQTTQKRVVVTYLREVAWDYCCMTSHLEIYRQAYRREIGAEWNTERLPIHDYFKLPITVVFCCWVEGR